MQLERFIALTSANEEAMAIASERLICEITRRDARISVLQGVRTAFEAQAVYANHGEIWRIGEDAGAPELDALVDRTIDDKSREALLAGTDQALEGFLGKTRVAA